MIQLDYRHVLDALVDPVVAADASNRIVYLNEATARLLGWTRDELLGQPLTVIQPSRFHAAHLLAFQRFMATGVPTILNHPIRVPALARDGTEIDIELMLTGLSLPDGETLAVASLRDLRARVELERQLSVTRYLRATAEAAARITSRLDIEHVLRIAVETMTAEFGAALARIWLYEPATHTLHLRASAGLSTATEESSRAHLDIATYPYKVGEVARTGKPFIKKGLAGDPQFDQEWVAREGIAAVAAFPLIIAGELRGVLVQFSRYPLPDELVQALGAFVAIVSAAVNDSELMTREHQARAEAEAVTERLRAIQAITDAALSRLALDDLLRELLARVRSILSVDVATILLLDDDGRYLRVQASEGLQEEVNEGVRIPVGRGVVGRIAADRTPLIVDDLSSVEIVSPQIRERVSSLMGAPLLVEGRTIGVIHVDTFHRRQFTEDDLRLLQLVADRIASPIEQARLYEAERRSRTEAEAAQKHSAFLDQISRVLASSLDYQVTLTNLANLVVPELADWCTIHIVEENGTVRPLTTTHRNPAKIELAQQLQARFPYDPDARYGVPEVIRSRTPQLVPEISRELLAGASLAPELLDVVRDLGLSSSIIVPLVARERVLGAITLVAAESGRRYGPADLALVEEVARRAAVAVDNARLYHDAQEALRMRDELLSSVSHDLKNPLTAIKGQAQVLQRRASRLAPQDGERILRGLESISNTADKMNRLINDLVDMARVRMGRPLDLNCASVDLVALARRVVAEHQEAARGHIEIQTDLPSVIGHWDGFRLERIFDNLVGNAIKYSPEGGRIIVRIHEEGSAGQAVLSVEDRGLGIPPDDLPHIFDRFYRGSNVVGRIEGTGIGLAGVKQIVEQHGGSVIVDSRVGEGTVVTVRLPLTGPQTVADVRSLT